MGIQVTPTKNATLSLRWRFVLVRRPLIARLLLRYAFGDTLVSTHDLGSI